MEKKAGRLYGREFMSHEENRRIKQQYDRIAARYDLVDRLIPRSWRVKATQLAYGRVLEAGVGTGLNLPYYTDRCQEIVGIDLSLPMLEQAAQRVHQCKVPVVLAEMDIQALDLASSSFDCVLVSFVFSESTCFILAFSLAATVGILLFISDSPPSYCSI